jgi:hypothetical protein
MMAEYRFRPDETGNSSGVGDTFHGEISSFVIQGYSQKRKLEHIKRDFFA